MSLIDCSVITDECMENPYPLADQTESELAALAASHNCTLVWGSESTLTVDLDTLEDIEKFGGRMLGLQCAGFDISYLQSWDSKSGNRHVLVHLEDAHRWSEPEKFMIQAALGSDPQRESCNLRRWMMGQKNVARLFKPIKS